ncbi:unnamed protein product [Schistocephalus solidus]|uniref:C2H2-type domain-containing protein n=1 Tax=Schistocephalus solidus TaxID=70667 RepID=A0A183SG48_SCHSO|nr:unnamed protein product [Schistocephalus solidus]
MTKPSQNAHAVSAPSARESVWLNIFLRNAITILLQLLSTLLPTPFPPPRSSLAPIPPLTPSHPCTYPSAPAILTATATPTTINEILPAPPEFSHPRCARNFTSRIGLVGHRQISRTEIGELVTEAPTYSRRARLHCPYYSRTFAHCKGLEGHTRLDQNLW